MLALPVNWYYAVGDKVNGPVSRAELESMFTAGTITVNTLVLQEGMYDWIHFVDLKKTTQILPVVGVTPKKPEEQIHKTSSGNQSDPIEPGG
jgi:hypothetical protein